MITAAIPPARLVNRRRYGRPPARVAMFERLAAILTDQAVRYGHPDNWQDRFLAVFDSARDRRAFRREFRRMAPARAAAYVAALDAGAGQ